MCAIFIPQFYLSIKRNIILCNGYETTKEEDITKKLFDQYGSVARKQMQKEGSVAAGSPVYKLVTSNDWSIVVKLDDSYYQELKDKTSVRVTITKDDISLMLR